MTLGFNTRVSLAFAAISILLVVATALAMFRLDGLWQVINVTEKETFPETLAAMRLSEKSALLAAGAPVLAASETREELAAKAAQFTKIVGENRENLRIVSRVAGESSLRSLRAHLDQMEETKIVLVERVRRRIELAE